MKTRSPSGRPIPPNTRWTSCSPKTTSSTSAWQLDCSLAAATTSPLPPMASKSLAALDRQAFDVVLMDVQMPEMGGLEASAAIRARERVRGGHLKIVAMTAHAMSGDRERCLEAGMDGYLPKPIDPALLYAAIEDEFRAPVRPSVDQSSLLARLGGDEALMRDVVRLFVDDCPSHLARIRAAIDARSSDRLRAEAHALKGAAANMSATEVVDAAGALELMGMEGRFDSAEAAWQRLAGAGEQALQQLRQIAG